LQRHKDKSHSSWLKQRELKSNLTKRRKEMTKKERSNITSEEYQIREILLDKIEGILGTMNNLVELTTTELKRILRLIKTNN